MGRRRRLCKGPGIGRGFILGIGGRQNGRRRVGRRHRRRRCTGGKVLINRPRKGVGSRFPRLPCRPVGILLRPYGFGCGRRRRAAIRRGRPAAGGAAARTAEQNAHPHRHHCDAAQQHPIAMMQRIGHRSIDGADDKIPRWHFKRRQHQLQLVVLNHGQHRRQDSYKRNRTANAKQRTADGPAYLHRPDPFIVKHLIQKIFRAPSPLFLPIRQENTG